MHLPSTEYCARSWGSMTKATAHQDSADCARTLLSQTRQNLGPACTFSRHEQPKEESFLNI